MQSAAATIDARLERDRAASLKTGDRTASLFKPTSSPVNHMMAHLTAHAKHKLAAKKEIHEMVNYVIFLVLFLVVVIQNTNGDDMFKFATLVRRHLVEKNFHLVNTSVYKAYDDVSNLDELYEYLENPFYGAIYGGDSFDGDTTSHANAPLYGGQGYLGGFGRILGTIRLGQVRVHGEPCPNLAAAGATLCFPEYSSATDSTESFGLGREPYESAHTHVNEPSYISITNRVYPGPTFTVELPNQEDATCNVSTKTNCTVLAAIEELRENKFWDMATRAIFIDLSVYNPHADVVAVVRLFLEHTDSGGLMPTVSVRPFRPYLVLQTFQDIAVFACNVLLYLVVLGQAVAAVKALRTAGIKYYSVRGNITNDINIVFFFVVVVFETLVYSTLPSTFQDDAYFNIRASAYYDYMSKSVNSLNCFLSILKIFKFLAFIPTFSMLTSTVSSAVDELIGLFVMIAILLFGGSLAFTIAFGTMLRHYSVLMNSFYALMGIFTLKFDAEEIYEGNRVLGPLFFLFFVSLIVLVIMHMLIACFANAYLEQKESLLHAQETKTETLGADILDHILHNIVFATPILGPRVFLPLYLYCQEVMARTTILSNDGLSVNEQQQHPASKYVVQVKSSTTERKKTTTESTTRIHPIAEPAAPPSSALDVTTMKSEINAMVQEIEMEHKALIQRVEESVKQLEDNREGNAADSQELADFLHSLVKWEEDMGRSVVAMKAAK
ncbi:Aste57867_10745 [Aphanomyces stellatus]|uniref:Aste57867_10745 protein n=1 Tax=Aphanomyces stellatus TaxID=120398 RepID=A0A485KR95_9STRA|nr:hypothetical protein As57867_010705 [Aphanomyces stellatus]VFT87615.1 Aste57867_10745 [Aphanomyces stellatus]